MTGPTARRPRGVVGTLGAVRATTGSLTPSRSGPPRMVARLADLDPDTRRLVRALVDAEDAARAREEDAGGDPGEAA